MGRTEAGQAWQADAETLLLLRAALQAGPAAQAAWDKWRARRSLDDIRGHDYYLLPAVCHNLLLAGAAGADLARLKGVSRKTWYDNQLLGEHVSAASSTLSSAGIRPLITGGLALAAGRPERLSQRSVDDTALVIPPGQALAAAQALRGAGWQPVPDGTDPVRTFPLWPRVRFRRGTAGPPLVLTWRILPEGFRSDSEQEIWRRVRPDAAPGAQGNLLDSTARFATICAEGIAWRAERDWRWVLDAANEMRTDLDCGGLFNPAQRPALSSAVQAVIAYLADEVGVGLPDALRATLNDAQAGPSAPGAAKRPGLTTRWRMYAEWCAAAHQTPTAQGFAGCLRSAWGLQSGWQMPGAVLRRMMARQ